MNRPPELAIIAPDASSEEAAAVIAALTQFMRLAAPVVPHEPAGRSGWTRTALLEGVSRQPAEAPPWA
jgi:hypothetical protein